MKTLKFITTLNQHEVEVMLGINEVISIEPIISTDLSNHFQPTTKPVLKVLYEDIEFGTREVLFAKNMEVVECI